MPGGEGINRTKRDSKMHGISGYPFSSSRQLTSISDSKHSFDTLGKTAHTNNQQKFSSEFRNPLNISHRLSSFIIASIVAVLAVGGLAADSLSKDQTRLAASSPGGFLFSEYLSSANSVIDGDTLKLSSGSFIVDTPQPFIWKDGSRIADRVFSAVQEVPLREWLMEYSLEEGVELSDFSDRFQQRVFDAGWNLGEVATQELVQAATRAGQQASFVRNLELELSTPLAGRIGQAGISALGALRERPHEVVAWELHGFVGEDERQGANVGLIYRRALQNALVGVNAFADYEIYDDESFTRWSAGAELRSAWLDLYANYYDAISDAVIRPPAAGSNNPTAIYSAGGYDAELNFHLPEHPWLVGVLGYYVWGGEEGEDDLVGFRAGIRFVPRGGPLALELLYTDGDEGSDFGGRVSFYHEIGKNYSYSSDDQQGFVPQEFFFTPVRREHSQRIYETSIEPDGSYSITQLFPAGSAIRITIGDPNNNQRVTDLLVTDVQGGNPPGLTITGILEGNTVAIARAYPWRLPFSNSDITLFTGAGAIGAAGTAATGVTIGYSTGGGVGTLVVFSTVILLPNLQLTLVDGKVSLTIQSGNYTLSTPERIVMFAGATGAAVIMERTASAARTQVTLLDDGGASIQLVEISETGTSVTSSFDCDSAPSSIVRRCALEPPSFVINTAYGSDLAAVTVRAVGDSHVRITYLETTDLSQSGDHIASLAILGGSGDGAFDALSAEGLAFDTNTRLLGLQHGAGQYPTTPGTIVRRATIRVQDAQAQGGSSISRVITVEVIGVSLTPLTASFIGAANRSSENSHYRVTGFFNESAVIATANVEGGNGRGYNYSIVGGAGGVLVIDSGSGEINLPAQRDSSGSRYIEGQTWTLAVKADDDLTERTPAQTLTLFLSVGEVSYPAIDYNLSSSLPGNGKQRAVPLTVRRSDNALATLSANGGAGGTSGTGNGVSYTFALAGSNQFSITSSGNDNLATLFFANGVLPTRSGSYVAQVRISDATDPDDGGSELSATLPVYFQVEAPQALSPGLTLNAAYPAAGVGVELSERGNLGARINFIETNAPPVTPHFARVGFNGGSTNAVMSLDTQDSQPQNLSFDAASGNLFLASGAYPAQAVTTTLTLSVQIADSQIGQTITAVISVQIDGATVTQISPAFHRISPSQNNPHRIRGQFGASVIVATVTGTGGVGNLSYGRETNSAAGLVLAGEGEEAGRVIYLTPRSENDPRTEVVSIVIRVSDQNTDTLPGLSEQRTPDQLITLYVSVTDVDYPDLSISHEINANITAGIGTSRDPYITDRRRAVFANINAEGGANIYNFSVAGSIFALRQIDADTQELVFNNSQLPSPPGTYIATVSVTAVLSNGDVIDTDSILFYVNALKAPPLNANLVPNSQYDANSFDAGSVSGQGAAIAVTYREDRANLIDTSTHIASVEIIPAPADGGSHSVTGIDDANLRLDTDNLLYLQGQHPDTTEQAVYRLTVEVTNDQSDSEEVVLEVAVTPSAVPQIQARFVNSNGNEVSGDDASSPLQVPAEFTNSDDNGGVAARLQIQQYGNVAGPGANFTVERQGVEELILGAEQDGFYDINFPEFPRLSFILGITVRMQDNPSAAARRDGSDFTPALALTLFVSPSTITYPALQVGQEEADVGDGNGEESATPYTTDRRRAVLANIFATGGAQEGVDIEDIYQFSTSHANFEVTEVASTDGSGRAELKFAGEQLPSPGVYNPTIVVRALDLEGNLIESDNIVVWVRALEEPDLGAILNRNAAYNANADDSESVSGGGNRIIVRHREDRGLDRTTRIADIQARPDDATYTAGDVNANLRVDAVNHDLFLQNGVEFPDTPGTTSYNFSLNVDLQGSGSTVAVLQVDVEAVAVPQIEVAFANGVVGTETSPLQVNSRFTEAVNVAEVNIASAGYATADNITATETADVLQFVRSGADHSVQVPVNTAPGTYGITIVYSDNSAGANNRRDNSDRTPEQNLILFVEVEEVEYPTFASEFVNVGGEGATADNPIDIPAANLAANSRVLTIRLSGGNNVYAPAASNAINSSGNVLQVQQGTGANAGEFYISFVSNQVVSGLHGFTVNVNSASGALSLPVVGYVEVDIPIALQVQSGLSGTVSDENNPLIAPDGTEADVALATVLASGGTGTYQFSEVGGDGASLLQVVPDTANSGQGVISYATVPPHATLLIITVEVTGRDNVRNVDYSERTIVHISADIAVVANLSPSVTYMEARRATSGSSPEEVLFTLQTEHQPPGAGVAIGCDDCSAAVAPETGNVFTVAPDAGNAAQVYGFTVTVSQDSTALASAGASLDVAALSFTGSDQSEAAAGTALAVPFLLQHTLTLQGATAPTEHVPQFNYALSGGNSDYQLTTQAGNVGIDTANNTLSYTIAIDSSAQIASDLIGNTDFILGITRGEVPEDPGNGGPLVPPDITSLPVHARLSHTFCAPAFAAASIGGESNVSALLANHDFYLHTDSGRVQNTGTANGYPTFPGGNPSGNALLGEVFSIVPAGLPSQLAAEESRFYRFYDADNNAGVTPAIVQEVPNAACQTTVAPDATPLMFYLRGDNWQSAGMSELAAVAYPQADTASADAVFYTETALAAGAAGEISATNPYRVDVDVLGRNAPLVTVRVAGGVPGYVIALDATDTSQFNLSVMNPDASAQNATREGAVLRLPAAFSASDYTVVVSFRDGDGTGSFQGTLSLYFTVTVNAPTGVSVEPRARYVLRDGFDDLGDTALPFTLDVIGGSLSGAEFRIVGCEASHDEVCDPDNLDDGMFTFLQSESESIAGVNVTSAQGSARNVLYVRDRAGASAPTTTDYTQAPNLPIANFNARATPSPVFDLPFSATVTIAAYSSNGVVFATTSLVLHSFGPALVSGGNGTGNGTEDSPFGFDLPPLRSSYSYRLANDHRNAPNRNSDYVNAGGRDFAGLGVIPAGLSLSFSGSPGLSFDPETRFFTYSGEGNSGDTVDGTLVISGGEEPSDDVVPLRVFFRGILASAEDNSAGVFFIDTPEVFLTRREINEHRVTGSNTRVYLNRTVATGYLFGVSNQADVRTYVDYCWDTADRDGRLAPPLALRRGSFFQNLCGGGNRDTGAVGEANAFTGAWFRGIHGQRVLSGFNIVFQIPVGASNWTMLGSNLLVEKVSTSPTAPPLNGFRATVSVVAYKGVVTATAQFIYEMLQMSVVNSQTQGTRSNPFSILPVITLTGAQIELPAGSTPLAAATLRITSYAQNTDLNEFNAYAEGFTTQKTAPGEFEFTYVLGDTLSPSAGFTATLEVARGRLPRGGIRTAKASHVFRQSQCIRTFNRATFNGVKREGTGAGTAADYSALSDIALFNDGTRVEMFWHRPSAAAAADKFIFWRGATDNISGEPLFQLPDGTASAPLAGDGISILDNTVTDNSARGLPANFYRVFTGTDGKLHIATEEAAPECAQDDLDGTSSRFFLNAGWGETTTHGDSRQTFAPINSQTSGLLHVEECFAYYSPAAGPVSGMSYNDLEAAFASVYGAGAGDIEYRSLSSSLPANLGVSGDQLLSASSQFANFLPGDVFLQNRSGAALTLAMFWQNSRLYLANPASEFARNSGSSGTRDHLTTCDGGSINFEFVLNNHRDALASAPVAEQREAFVLSGSGPFIPPDSQVQISFDTALLGRGTADAPYQSFVAGAAAVRAAEFRVTVAASGGGNGGKTFRVAGSNAQIDANGVLSFTGTPAGAVVVTVFADDSGDGAFLTPTAQREIHFNFQAPAGGFAVFPRDLYYHYSQHPHTGDTRDVVFYTIYSQGSSDFQFDRCITPFSSRADLPGATYYGSNSPSSNLARHAMCNPRSNKYILSSATNQRALRIRKRGENSEVYYNNPPLVAFTEHGISGRTEFLVTVSSDPAATVTLTMHIIPEVVAENSEHRILYANPADRQQIRHLEGRDHPPSTARTRREPYTVTLRYTGAELPTVSVLLDTIIFRAPNPGGYNTTLRFRGADWAYVPPPGSPLSVAAIEPNYVGANSSSRREQRRDYARHEVTYIGDGTEPAVLYVLHRDHLPSDYGGEQLPPPFDIHVLTVSFNVTTKAEYRRYILTAVGQSGNFGLRSIVDGGQDVYLHRGGKYIKAISRVSGSSDPIMFPIFGVNAPVDYGDVISIIPSHTSPGAIDSAVRNRSNVYRVVFDRFLGDEVRGEEYTVAREYPATTEGSSADHFCFSEDWSTDYNCRSQGSEPPLRRLFPGANDPPPE